MVHRIHRRAFHVLGLCIAVLLVVSFSLRNAATDSTVGRAFREEREGWIFVHIQGEPRARGYQYGFLVAPEIDDFITTLKVYLQQNTTKDWEFYRQAAKEIFLPKLEREYLQEPQGIAAGLQAAGYQYDVLDIITENG